MEINFLRFLYEELEEFNDLGSYTDVMGDFEDK